MMDCLHRRSEVSYPHSSLKRTFSAMQSRPSSHPHTHHHHHHRPHRDSTQPRQSPTYRFTLPARYAGDGLDMRRPVMSGHVEPLPEPPIISSNFVDLTGSDDVEPDTRGPHPTHHFNTSDYGMRRSYDQPAGRPPRFANEILRRPEVIDLEENSDQESNHEQPRPGRPAARVHPQAPTSPEIEFIGIQARQAPLPQMPVPRQPVPAATIAPGHHPHHILPDPRTHHAVRPPGRPSYPRFAHSLQIFQRIQNSMNFNLVGFNLANVEPAAEAPAPPQPTIDPLPPPREGFTRAPKEDDILICPSCGDELSVGDSDVKRQVWAIRACGHVYCGDCARKENRPAGSSRKRANGKAPAMFSKCVVEGCGKSVMGAKSMVQLFL